MPAPDIGIEVSVPHQLLWETLTVLKTYVACASTDDGPATKVSSITEESAEQVLEALHRFVWGDDESAVT